MTIADRQQFAVQMRHTFRAPIDRVFDAWTKPEHLRQWFGSPGTRTTDAEVDLRVGGRYGMTLEIPVGGSIPEGGSLRIVGEFREITPPTRLVYTWSVEPSRETLVRDSLVTVEFEARGDWTDLTLQHEALPSELEQTKHRKGWNGCCESLDAFLADPVRP